MMQNLPGMRSINYRQHADTEIRTLILPATVLLYIEEGSKYVSSLANAAQCATSGEFALLPANTEFTVRNRLGSKGNYHAQVLVFKAGTLSQHCSSRPINSEEFRCFAGPIEMIEAFTRLRAALNQQDLPSQVLQARFYELKAWLTRFGIQLPLTQINTLSQKLKTLLSTDLTHPWRGTEVATQLGMSEATFRRNLAREGSSFTAILRESRLQCALERLQTTKRSLSEIAYHTGFSSHSHFTDVFRKRFEFPPSHLRARKEVRMIEI